jgi:hypothetical protein
LASQINASNSGFGGIVSTGDSSGQLQLQTTGTTALTIDTSQNVGIGTSSPGQKLQISNTSSSGFAAIRMAADSRSYDVGVGGSASGFQQNNWYIYDVTAAATRMVIDSSGRVTMPFQPAFYGYRTAGNVGATTTVLHNVVVTNVGSCYNSGTGIFTCPVAGVYEIYAGGHGENSQPTVLDIQLNGTTVAQEYFNGAAYGVNSLMAIISCAANDQIKSVVTTGTFWAGNISGLKMTVKLIG